MKEFKRETYLNLLKDSGDDITRENLFLLLGKVQDTFGYVPKEVVDDVAARTGLTDTQIYGALTSYKEFKIGREVNN